jgi:WD40 repeat protein
LSRSTITPVITLDHNSSVYSVAWSPDSNYLATGSWDNTAKIWNAKTGTLLHTLIGHHGTVRSVAWSPDGNYLATGSYDRTAKIWDAKNGALLHTLDHNHSVYSVAWSPDGNYLATGSYDRTAKIWNIPQLQNLSLEQALFLALVYHNHVNNQQLILNHDHKHLHSIYHSLPVDIQNSIRDRIIIEETQQIEEIQTQHSEEMQQGWREWRLGGLASGAAVAGFIIYKWLRK